MIAFSTWDGGFNVMLLLIKFWSFESAHLVNSIKVWIVLVDTISNLPKNCTKVHIHVGFQKFWKVYFKNHNQ